MQAQEAIIDERKRRDYEVVVTNTRRAFGMCGIGFPQGIEGYVADTICTVEKHKAHPCEWRDFAFRLEGGTFFVVLMSDVARPGMMIEDSVRLLIHELLSRIPKR